MVFLIDYLAAGVVDSTGAPYSGGSVSFYQAESTTLQTVYQERELVNPHPNPAVLDSSGKLIAFASTRLKIVVAKADGSAQLTTDNVGIGSGEILAGDISAGAVTSSTIADGSVVNSKIADNSISTSQIVDAAVTTAKRASVGQQISSSCGTFLINSTSFTNVTNLSVSITTSGRPVCIALQSDGTGSAASIGINVNGTTQFSFLRGATEIARVAVISSSGTASLFVPSSSFSHIDQPAAGTYTYKMQAQTSSGTTANVNNSVLVAYELP